MIRVALASVLALCLILSNCAGAPPLEPPRLVVVIVVDQMRGDFLDRFADGLTGGLARLMREGRVFTDAHQDHGATFSGPGYATVSTGVFPGRAGIVGNAWWDRDRKSAVNCVGNRQYPLVHARGRAAAPTSLRVDTLNGWLREASPSSRIVSVAIKDRAAILLGGQRPDEVYWYHGPSGRFVTSTYYRHEYPDWIREWNKAGHADAWVETGWQRLLEPEAYSASREDSFPHENDGTHTTLPHTLAPNGVADADYYQRVPYAPLGDEITLDLALAALDARRLGTDEATDLLWIGLSAADYVGHQFGPYSHEVQDYYLRLDRMLGEMMQALDEQVGEGRYHVVLTSDHGVMPMPEELESRGIAARRMVKLELNDPSQRALETALAEAGLPTHQAHARLLNGIAFRLGDFEVTDEQFATIRAFVAERLGEVDGVAAAYSFEQLAGDERGPWIDMHRRAFDPERSSDVILHLEENVLLSAGTTGTAHGTAHAYDTHVPMIFFGPGVEPGTVEDRVRTVDIAPTLASMLGIPFPEGLDGAPLDVD